MIEVSSHDLDMMANTILAEGRSEDWIGQVAIGWAIRNRFESPVKWWKRENDTVPDDTIAAVCVDAWQFSGLNVNDPNLRYAMIIPPTHPVYLRALQASLAVILDTEADPTSGACHYYAKSMPTPPRWWEGQDPSLETDGHLFFNNIR